MEAGQGHSHVGSGGGLALIWHLCRLQVSDSPTSWTFPAKHVLVLGFPHYPHPTGAEVLKC